jgi:hypothetical protein
MTADNIMIIVEFLAQLFITILMFSCMVSSFKTTSTNKIEELAPRNMQRNQPLVFKPYTGNFGVDMAISKMEQDAENRR